MGQREDDISREMEKDHLSQFEPEGVCARCHTHCGWIWDDDRADHFSDCCGWPVKNERRD